MALQRAVLTDMGVLDDPFARGMLGPSMAATGWVVSRLGDRVSTRSATLAGFGARVLWIDTRSARHWMPGSGRWR